MDESPSFNACAAAAALASVSAVSAAAVIPGDARRARSILRPCAAGSVGPTPPTAVMAAAVAIPVVATSAAAALVTGAANIHPFSSAATGDSLVAEAAMAAADRTPVTGASVAAGSVGP